MTNSDQTTIRAFIAINLPHELKVSLGAFQRKLGSRVPSDWVRWTATEQIHLTLRFLGNVGAGAVPEITSALHNVCAATKPFELSAENFGWFPEGNRPRVLWVGVAGQIDKLNELAGAVAAATANWGESEDRQFQAHLTIGRVKTKLPNDLRKLAEILHEFRPGTFGLWRVTNIDLMQSQLYPTGPVYSCLATVPLGG
ncbi:MAG: RNA 2',3'-cyclic phosphodiesterase [Verrucomicrobiae bacterium]|nr:RNA 2',3'-cyclic phosphodiesterase [Verrucomicrobiae bacterium]